MSADNYTFIARKEKDKEGVLTIKPRPLAVVAANDVKISKVYDGNTNVRVLEKGKDYQFAGIDQVQSSGIAKGDEDKVILSFKKAYDNPNAGGPSKDGDIKNGRHVEMTEMAINNANYYLTNTSLDLPAEITKRPLHVSANSLEITYGDEAPTYELTYEDNFAEDESSANLSKIQLVCAYNQANEATLGAGNYTISANGMQPIAGKPNLFSMGEGFDTNYDVTFTPGTLTVNKAVLTVKTAPGMGARTEIVEGDQRLLATYGKDPFPELSVTAKGYKYPEDEAKVTISVNAFYLIDNKAEKDPSACVAPDENKTNRINITRGIYPVYPKVSTLPEDPNYAFVAASMDLRIERYGLTVTGIEIGDRIYDGTTNVYDGQINESNLQFQGLLERDQKYLEDHKITNKIVVKAHYESKDVQTDGTVSFDSLDPGTYLVDRCYVLDKSNDNTTQKSATSSINPRPVRIKVNEIPTIKYGDQVPDFDVTYNKTENSHSGLVIDGLDIKLNTKVKAETADKTNVDLTTNYSAKTGSYSPVGIYTVSANNFHNTSGNDNLNVSNYAPEYINGKFEVVQAQLQTPTPIWDTSAPGTVSWNASSQIGDVVVGGYEVKLYRDGSEVTNSTKEVSANTLSVDYKDLIHRTGAGKYTVTVQAMASETNNEDHKNVANSAEGSTGDKYLYAANVTVRFSSDSPAGSGKNIWIQSADQKSTVLIAGEKTVIGAKLANATGYTATIESSDTRLAISQNKMEDVTDTYNSSVSLDQDYTINGTQTGDIQVTMKLSARPATVAVTVSANSNTAVYGYSDNKAPRFSAEVAHTDKVSPDGGYTYSYQWQLYDKNDSKAEPVYTISAGSRRDFTFPTGKDANEDEAQRNNYRVRCIVTATRKDNGQTAVSMQDVNDAEHWDVSRSDVANVVITRATFTTSVSMNGWQYGQKRETPTVETTLDSLSDKYERNPQLNNVIYEYAATPSGSEWTPWDSSKYTDVGTYYVRARYNQSNNYKASVSEPVPFKITQAELGTPDEKSLTMNVTPHTASYGTISWNSVPGVRENGTGSDSASSVGVKYCVKLYRKNSAIENYPEAPVHTYNDIEDTKLVILEELQQSGIYMYTVQAIDVEDSGKDNCKPGSVVRSQDYIIGGIIETQGGSVSGNKLTHVYDSNLVTLTAKVGNSDGGNSYQWYKNGELLSGKTSPSISLYKVADNGRYDCVIAKGTDKIYTTYMDVQITPRPITVYSVSANKPYDGAPLTAYEWWIVDGNLSSAHGFSKYSSVANVSVGSSEAHDIVTGVQVIGSQTAAGSSTNNIDFSEMRIVRGTEEVYSSNMSNPNYTVKVKPGTLEVTKGMAVSINAIPDVVYNGEAQSPEPEVFDYNRKDKTGSQEAVKLVKGVDYKVRYENNTEAGTAKVIISGINNYDGEAQREFTILQRPITVESDSQTWVYDRESHRMENDPKHIKDVSSVQAGQREVGLVSGNKIAGVEFTASITSPCYKADGSVGSVDNTFTNVKIHDAAGKDVTKNYTITPSYGTLSVVPLAYLSGSKGNEGWFISSVSMNAPQGYEISKSPNGGFADSICDAEETDKNGRNISYYLRNKNNPKEVYGVIGSAYADENTRTVVVYDYKIDTSYPVGEIDVRSNKFRDLISAITFGYFYENSVDATISANDIVSGIDSISYYVDDVRNKKVPLTADQLKDVKWTAGTTATVNANANSVVYARLEDKAGHVTYLSTDGLVVYTDSVYDTEKVDYTRTTKEDKTATVKLNGNTIKSLSLNGMTLTDAQVSVSGNEIMLKGTYLDTLPAGDYKATVTYRPGGKDYQERQGNERPATTTFTVKVEKSNQGPTFTASDKVYDGTAYSDPEDIKTGSKGKKTYTYWQIDGTGNETQLDGAPTDVGTYKVQVTVAGDEYYNQTSSAQVFNITKRPVTITAASATKVYDGEPLAVSANSVTVEPTGEKNGIAKGDHVEAVCQIVEKGGDTPETRINAGSSDNVIKKIQILRGSTDVTSNYEIIKQKGIIRVDKAEQIINVTDQSYVYDGKSHSIVGATVSGNNVKSTASAPGEISYSVNNKLVNVSDGPVTVTVTAAETENYKKAEKTVTLSVTGTHFPAPLMTGWNSDNPGTFTWKSVSANGLVEPQGYNARLVAESDGKDEPVADKFVEGGTEVDFADAIRAHGPGVYKVQLQTVASKINNPNKTNVADSDWSVSSNAIYAARVVLKEDGNDDTKMGLKTMAIGSTENASETSYVAIAGEKLMVTTAVNEVKDAIYTLSKVEEEKAEADEPKLAIGDKGLFTRAVTVTGDLQSTADIPVIVGLTHEKGTVKKQCEVDAGAPQSTFNNTLQDLIAIGTLNADEVEAVEEGENVRIVLKVKNMPVENLLENDKNKIDTKANESFGAVGNPNITVTIRYFDVTLFVYVTNTKKENGQVNVTESERQILDSKGDISITITVPEEMRKKGRIFELFHLKHDGSVESLGRFTTDTYTFTTREFSIYALAYYDEVGSSDDNNGSQNNGGQNNGSTTDSTKPSTAPTPTAEPTPTEEPAPTEEPNPTVGPAPTVEPQPTIGPSPTAKPNPTATPKPADSKQKNGKTRNTAAVPTNTVYDTKKRQENERNKDIKAGNANTGDTSAWSLWLLTFTASLMAILWVLKRRRDDQNHET